MNIRETLAIATIPAIFTAGFAYLRNRVDILKYKADSMAERTAPYYLKHKGYTAGSSIRLRNTWEVGTMMKMNFGRFWSVRERYVSIVQKRNKK